MAMKGASTEAEKTAMAGKDYLGLIGSLLYVTNMTRPDCAFHVSFLAQLTRSSARVDAGHTCGA